MFSSNRYGSGEYMLHKHINADGSEFTEVIRKPNPNIVQNLKETTMDLVHGGFADGPVAEARLITCKACPHFIDDSRCRLCGCYMIAKTKVALARCPENRWPDSQQTYDERQVAPPHLAGVEPLDKMN